MQTQLKAGRQEAHWRDAKESSRAPESRMAWGTHAYVCLRDVSAQG